MAFGPAAGCRHVLLTTADLTDETKASDAVLIFGTLFGDRISCWTRRPDFSSIPIEERADILFKLVTRAYEVVHPLSDIQHDGAYSPGTRDHAEAARSFLFEQLVKLGGRTKPTARYTNSPRWIILRYMKDRLRQMTVEVAARASEPEPMPLDVFRSLDEEQNLIPTDNRSIHKVMLDRVDDFFHFVESSEFSPKAKLFNVWKKNQSCAGI